MASFSRLSFEYEERSINIAKIQSYNTGKNVSFVSHYNLDLRKIDLFLYASIPFVGLYQYHFVVQPNILNYGTIRTCLRKGFYISMKEYEAMTTGVERK